MAKKCSISVPLLILASALYLSTDPLRIGPLVDFPDFQAHSVDWPSPSELKYEMDMENKLSKAELRFEDEIRGPESIVFDLQGKGPYAGISDGRIVRWDGPEKGWIEFAVTSANRTEICAPKSPPAPNLKYEHICGRPLGLRFDKRTGNLFIADAYMGLMMVGPRGGLAKLLTNEAQGLPLTFTNDLDIDDDGVIYFTDSSSLYQRRDFFVAVLAGDNTGRFLKYDPATKETTVLLKGLRFPNGVAFSKDKTHIIIAESVSGRLLRYWTKGPKAGTKEIFAWVPGTPDNVRVNEKGEFWVAIHARRNWALKFFGAHPKVRAIFFRLPISMKVHYLLLSGLPHGIALKFSPQGQFLQSLEDRTGKVTLLSEVEEQDGKLWLGTVIWNHIAVYNSTT